MVDKGLKLGPLSRKDAERFIEANGYCRVKGYGAILEKDGRFIPGTSLSDISNIMELEQKLRSLLLSMVSPVEIALRARLSQTIAEMHGEYALFSRDFYRTEKNFENLTGSFDREVKRQQDNGNGFAVHYLAKYGRLPCWAMVELLSLGTLSKVYGAMQDTAAQKRIARGFGVPAPYLKSWMEYITQIRNICAHQSRLYNRVFRIRPRLMREHRHIDNARLFPVFIVLLRLHEAMSPAKAQEARRELGRIVDAHPGVNLRPMGFPADWRQVLAVPSGEPRSRGRGGGRKPKDPEALAEALRMYNSRSYAISEIVEVTRISTSTLYKYIHLQDYPK